jgi:hypothetical protein
VLLHVRLDAVVHLRGGVGELARQREQHADLDGLLRVQRERRGHERGGKAHADHVVSSCRIAGF